MNRDAMNNIVLKTMEELKNEMKSDEDNDKPLSQFSDTNPASNPQYELDKNNFCNIYTLKGILNNHNNKRSSGTDGIPNIAIKNLLNIILHEYTIIFNNLLNDYHFPDKWNIAKVKAVKKGERR